MNVQEFQAKLAEICKLFEEKDYNKKELVARIYEQMNHLLDVATRYGFDTNLWHNYIAFFVMMNENPFSLVCEKNRIKEGTVTQIVLEDFSLIRKIFFYDFSKLEKALSINSFSLISNYNAVEKKKNIYKEEQLQYLQQKAQEPGMVVLESGVMYRWIERGSGTQYPKGSSIVYVNYTGRLTDGTVFDTTQGQPLPACFVVRTLIMGWQIALSRMRAGDRMEVYIPAQYGYGKTVCGDIPAHSTLIFELELIKMELR